MCIRDRDNISEVPEIEEGHDVFKNDDEMEGKEPPLKIDNAKTTNGKLLFQKYTRLCQIWRNLRV